MTKQTKAFLVIGCIGVILILLIVLAVLLIGGAADQRAGQIHLADYVTIDEIYGVNGYATAVYSLDEDRLVENTLGTEYEAVGSEINTAAAIIMATAYHENVDTLRKSITVTIDEKNGSYSNGDTVRVSVAYDEVAAGLLLDKELIDSTAELPVSGLAEGITIDLFSADSIAITYGDKPSGIGTVSIENRSGLDGLSYQVEQNGTLKNGDSVTVTATMDESNYHRYFTENPQEKKYAFARTSTATVTLDAHAFPVLATADDITDPVVKAAEQRVLAYCGEYGNRTNVSIVGIYFADMIDKNKREGVYKNYFYPNAALFSSSRLYFYNSLNVVVRYTKDAKYTWTDCYTFTDIYLDDNGNPVLPLYMANEYESGVAAFDTAYSAKTAAEVMAEFEKDAAIYTTVQLK